MNNIETSVNQLLRTKPFYAHFFLNSIQSYDSKKVPTAGVGINNGRTEFHWNNEWLNKLSPTELKGVIEHEVMHVLYEHITFDYKGNKVNPSNANLAQDCAINQFIEGLPACAVTLQSLEKSLGKKLKPKQTWKYYYNEITQFAKNNPDKCLPDTGLDSHDWGDSNGAPKSEAEVASSRAAIKNAIDQAIKQSKGNVPKEVLEILDSFKSEPKLPWRTILSNFVARSRSVIKIPTRTRRNRRFGLKAPGFKVKKELTLAVCVDSSGSVDNDQFKAFMNEICRISTMCSKVYLIEADCVVQKVSVLKKKAPEFKRHSSGGTAYQPAIDEAIRRGCDAIAYFGDMDSADVPNNPGKPFLWVIVGEQNPPADFGAVVRLET